MVFIAWFIYGIIAFIKFVQDESYKAESKQKAINEGRSYYWGSGADTYSVKTDRQIYHTVRDYEGRKIETLSELKSGKCLEAYDCQTKEPIYYKGYKCLDGSYVGGMK